jgi:hypothetical protein
VVECSFRDKFELLFLLVIYAHIVALRHCFSEHVPFMCIAVRHKFHKRDGTSAVWERNRFPLLLRLPWDDDPSQGWKVHWWAQYHSARLQRCALIPLKWKNKTEVYLLREKVICQWNRGENIVGSNLLAVLFSFQGISRKWQVQRKKVRKRK